MLHIYMMGNTIKIVCKAFKKSVRQNGLKGHLPVVWWTSVINKFSLNVNCPNKSG